MEELLEELEGNSNSNSKDNNNSNIVNHNSMILQKANVKNGHKILTKDATAGSSSTTASPRA